MDIGSLISSLSFFIIGLTLLNSSSSETGSEPGLELSPPISIISAPSLTICFACLIALFESKNKLPSEKESGVTLRIPIIKVLLNLSSNFPHLTAFSIIIFNFFLEFLHYFFCDCSRSIFYYFVVYFIYRHYLPRGICKETFIKRVDFFFFYFCFAYFCNLFCYFYHDAPCNALQYVFFRRINCVVFDKKYIADCAFCYKAASINQYRIETTIFSCFRFCQNQRHAAR